MRLVDDVDLERPQRRGQIHLLAQVANLVDAAVRRRIDLDEVQRRTRGHLDARLALVAWFSGIARAARAVERLREQARGRRLTRAARTAEQVRVLNALSDSRAL